MNNSVETRYPFLDEAVVAFLAKVDPRWKLRGFREKYAAAEGGRALAAARGGVAPQGHVPRPLDSFHLDKAPPFVDQLLSEESLRKTGYFDPKAVTHWRQAYRRLRVGGLARTSVEMGLVAVTATQMWHHTFLDGGLADLPSFRVRSEEGGVSSEHGERDGAEQRDAPLLTPPSSLLTPERERPDGVVFAYNLVVRTGALPAGRAGRRLQRAADRAAVRPAAGAVRDHVDPDRPHARRRLDGGAQGAERGPGRADQRGAVRPAAEPAGGGRARSSTSRASATGPSRAAAASCA